ncbi:MAG TPA: capsule assembly Wzi family protein [Gemmatimonadaceae bacterium]|nr:capsule assembly Wzi family protein [Gemmatimonadaceae bacterium]
MTTIHNPLWAIALAALPWVGIPTLGTAQTDAPPRAHVTAGNEAEEYLRALQVAGLAPAYPWSVRAFSPSEVDSLSRVRGPHPWSGRYAFGDAGRSALRIAPVSIQTIVNTGYAWGMNDGAIWAGRGPTVAVSAGFAGRFGALSFAVNPVAFRAGNSSFDLAPNGQDGQLVFGDALYPGAIDRPQRFGDAPYTRVDAGQSYVRLDVGKLAIGVSTANEWWGPATRYPLILGNNAPGFLHGFIGTAAPINLWLARAHVRAQWGRLEQSAYSPVTGSKDFVSSTEPGHSRFAPGLALVLQPRGAEGLELGLARFFHFYMPSDGIGSLWWKPFEGVLRDGRSTDDSSAFQTGDEGNQLLSVFARWVFPRAGAEAYFEYGREDHNADVNDFLQEPDHIRSYMLGVGKTVARGPSRLHVLRAEVVNFQMAHLVRHRGGQGRVYLHSNVRQGHTNRGQLLGAPVGAGAAAGSSLSWETYTPAGKWASRATRTVTRDFGEFHETATIQKASPGVAYELDVSSIRFTRVGEVSLGAGLVRELNRTFSESGWNAQVRVGLQRHF